MTRRAPRKGMNGADFLAAAKAAWRREKIEIEGLETPVYVRCLSAAENRRIGEACRKAGAKASDPAGYDNEAFMRAMIAACLVDGAGRRLIPEEREAEIEDMPNHVALALQRAVLKVNGMDLGAADASEGNA